MSRAMYDYLFERGHLPAGSSEPKVQKELPIEAFFGDMPGMNDPESDIRKSFAFALADTAVLAKPIKKHNRHRGFPMSMLDFHGM